MTTHTEESRNLAGWHFFFISSLFRLVFTTLLRQLE